MAKRKTPKTPDQPELPLADTPPASPILAEVKLAPSDAPPSKGPPSNDGRGSEDAPLARNYRAWFLEYASYVILDRAVPHLDDGLKPVQRRILHTLWEMDDGRFHKVANVVGASLRFHPHGAAVHRSATHAVCARCALQSEDDGLAAELRRASPRTGDLAGEISVGVT